MSPARVLGSVSLLAVVAFSAFGILATFEPLPAGAQWTWRIVYGSAIAGCLLALRRLWVGPRSG